MSGPVVHDCDRTQIWTCNQDVAERAAGQHAGALQCWPPVCRDCLQCASRDGLFFDFGLVVASQRDRPLRENLAINNPTPSARRGLLAVLTFYGLAHTAAQEKKEMQDKAMSQTDWGDAGEREAMLDYCASDSSALYALLATMLEKIHIPTALMRGRYTPAVARMERIGIPTDVELYRALSDNWEEIKVFFIKRDAAPFGVYEGTSLRQHLLAAYFHEHGIEWPLTPSGSFKLDRDTRRDQARAYPELKPLLTLMSTITDLKISSAACGVVRWSRQNMVGTVLDRDRPQSTVTRAISFRHAGMD